MTEGITQGDNLAMSFYALVAAEMQNHLQIIASEVKQVWLVHDVTGARTLESFKKWWIIILEIDVHCGYYVKVNPGLFSKTKHFWKKKKKKKKKKKIFLKKKKKKKKKKQKVCSVTTK